MVDPDLLDDVDILTHTVYGEARGESAEGQAAVAWIVRNRVAKRREYMGTTIKDVCLKPYQFSCWNFGSDSRQTLLHLQTDNELYKKIRQVVEKVLNGTIPDNTKGSTHYHEKGIKPYWKKSKIPVVTIGHHTFYNNVD